MLNLVIWISEFLKNREYDADDFVYLDPPYLISACEYNKGWG